MGQNPISGSQEITTTRCDDLWFRNHIDQISDLSPIRDLSITIVIFMAVMSLLRCNVEPARPTLVIHGAWIMENPFGQTTQGMREMRQSANANLRSVRVN
jgi:hypothetical protein